MTTMTNNADALTTFAWAAHELGAQGHAPWAVRALAAVWTPAAVAAAPYALPYLEPCREPEFLEALRLTVGRIEDFKRSHGRPAYDAQAEALLTWYRELCGLEA